MSRSGLALLLLASAASAQEAINTNAATQPGVGSVTLREQLRWYEGEERLPGGRADVSEGIALTSLFAGIRHDLTLGAEVPLRIRDADFQGVGNLQDDSGELDIGDVRLLGKWRFWRHDTGPIDTQRLGLLFGLQLDTASGRSIAPWFARDSTDPMLGVVYTRVSGRHGLNASIEATLSTAGRADELRHDAAWLYRVSPQEYTADTHAAWYGVLEWNGRSETNGDHEAFLAPGLMYEARKWTGELSVQVPVLQELDHRAEIDFAVVLGVRLLF